MEIELKPCPFCDGKAKILKGGLSFLVKCLNENCEATIAGCASEWQAAEAWNTRVHESPNCPSLHTDEGV